MMAFVKTASGQPAADYLVRTIREKLDDGQRVLWLVPGGSSIAVVAMVGQQLAGTDLSNLSVSLTDERYGPDGHVDSNWRQLAESGFSLPGARLEPVLQGLDMSSTVKKYGQMLEELLTIADYALGFFGIGPDGHTAGILPGSEAATTDLLSAGYEGGGFTRMTMTPPAIGRLDEAVVYATGESKREALENLERELPVVEQPAQSLKKIAKLTIFNDLKGESA